MRPLAGLLAGILLVFARPVSAQSFGQTGPERYRFFIDVNFLGSTISAAEGTTYQYSIIHFGEVATLKAHYPKPSDDRLFPLVDVGGGIMFGERFGVGAQFTQVTFRDSATLEAILPHPFYLHAPATGTSETASLNRTEIAVHVFATVTALRTSRTEWRFSGGPSFLFYSADMVSDIFFSQTATPDSPDNVVTVTGYSTANVSASGLSFHVAS